MDSGISGFLPFKKRHSALHTRHILPVLWPPSSKTGVSMYMCRLSVPALAIPYPTSSNTVACAVEWLFPLSHRPYVYTLLYLGGNCRSGLFFPSFIPVSWLELFPCFCNAFFWFGFGTCVCFCFMCGFPFVIFLLATVSTSAETTCTLQITTSQGHRVSYPPLSVCSGRGVAAPAPQPPAGGSLSDGWGPRQPYSARLHMATSSKGGRWGATVHVPNPTGLQTPALP